MAGENVPLSPVVDLLTRQPYIEPDNMPLEDITDFGGGSGGGKRMDPSVSMKEYVDARDDAVESRLSGLLSQKPSTATFWGGVAAIIAAMFTAVAIVLATLAFGSDRFNGGLSVSPLVAQTQANQSATDKEQDTKIQLMNDKLDVIIKQTAKK